MTGSIGLAVHPMRPAATRLANAAVQWAEQHGHEVTLVASDASVIGRPDLGREPEGFAEGLDLMVSFGGDGTMLRTVNRVAAVGTPVLGVNVGQLGYLTVVEPDDLISALERFFAGDYAIDERMLASVTLDAPSMAQVRPTGDLALNEVVLEKTPMGHTVRLAVTFDDTFFTTYAADGVILATPTGSTAYSFSARGPIVAPAHRALILTPVSPHMLFDRPLVLEPTTKVRLEVIGPRPALLSIDGRTIGTLQEGDALVCSGSEIRARLVTFASLDFHQILKSKFGLNDR